jgi:hypothetical protein
MRPSQSRAEGESCQQSRKNPASLAGVVVLGIVAIICVVGVLKLASAPASDATRTKVTSPSAKADAGTPKGAPQVTEVASPQDSTGLSILGTIGSAAVGGIAGMLTLARGAGEGPTGSAKPSASGGTPAKAEPK